ncbi:phosphoribosylformylglycinamidine synthase subunit PurS [Thermoflavimicrobium daqui]|uniref:Phosphoribosylformylglycinamidine synthase subunit PurS n=1 Tax=Thermoflavimicrobium daqui TaxID=2137476 RepID=A0A364K189_9BACL|nr:phosphoribosylformylglycinamidine synthase subunit PurS [Thermoflavimicrobium daqui]RAL21460.1 phosphoribosylformylglycinamidine synthase [Thermoflavimicrobium daqui]
MFKATIFVTLKESVLDPQGVAVKNSLHSLGLENVHEVRIGKRLEVFLDQVDRKQAEAQVQMMCEKLLANPVMENYRYELEEVS